MNEKEVKLRAAVEEHETALELAAGLIAGYRKALVEHGISDALADALTLAYATQFWQQVRNNQ